MLDIRPTPEDMARDLVVDYETATMQDVGLHDDLCSVEIGEDCDCDLDLARKAWPAAIRRGLSAEQQVTKLRDVVRQAWEAMEYVSAPSHLRQALAEAMKEEPRDQ